MKLLRYIQSLLTRNRASEAPATSVDSDRVDPGYRDELEQQVRGEARRYEADLRELART